jgi:hypothetical protein
MDTASATTDWHETSNPNDDDTQSHGANGAAERE